jgi:hypothetical protein
VGGNGEPSRARRESGSCRTGRAKARRPSLRSGLPIRRGSRWSSRRRSKPSDSTRARSSGASPFALILAMACQAATHSSRADLDVVRCEPMSARATLTSRCAAARSRLESGSGHPGVPRAEHLLNSRCGRMLDPHPRERASSHARCARPCVEPGRLAVVPRGPSSDRSDDLRLIPCNTVVEIARHLAMKVAVGRAGELPISLPVVACGQAMGPHVRTEVVVQASADTAWNPPVE